MLAKVLFTGITYKLHPDDKDEKRARLIDHARKDEVVDLVDSEFERLFNLGAVTKASTDDKKAADEAEPEDTPASTVTGQMQPAKRTPERVAAQTPQTPQTPESKPDAPAPKRRASGRRASARSSRAKKS